MKEGDHRSKVADSLPVIPAPDVQLLHRLDLACTAANIHAICNLRQIHLGTIDLVARFVESNDVQEVHRAMALYEESLRRIVRFLAEDSASGVGRRPGCDLRENRLP